MHEKILHAEYRWQWVTELDNADIERLADFLGRVLVVDNTVGFPGPIPPERAREAICKMGEEVQSGRWHVFTGDFKGRPVAQCVLVPNTSPNNKHTAWIIRTMIDPEFRKHGLVRTGMKKLVERCESLGVEVLLIDVRAGTPAEAIWRHLGFQSIGVLPDYARIDGKSYEGLFMYIRVADLKEGCVA